MKEDLERIHSAGLEAADPGEAVRRSPRVEGSRLLAGDASSESRRVFVLAAELETISMDTDGNDGPTDATAGIVDGGTDGRIHKKGVYPTQALLSNDAYAARGAGDALLMTGPTGTNTNDLRVVFVDGDRREEVGGPVAR